MKTLNGLLNQQLGELAAIAAAKEKSATVFILARYNHLKPGNLKRLQTRYQGQLTIEFKSAHRSKGP